MERWRELMNAVGPDVASFIADVNEATMLAEKGLHPTQQCYEIEWSNGCVDWTDTETEALSLVEDRLGHPPVIKQGPDRTLCWDNTEDAEDDDGTYAQCTIRKIDSETGETVQ